MIYTPYITKAHSMTEVRSPKTEYLRNAERCAALAAKAEDLQLQPSDILYVPESGAKQAMYRAVEIGLAVGTGVALYRLAYH